MKKTLINRLYELFEEEPNITNAEAADRLDTTSNIVKTMRHRLRAAGYIEFEDEGVQILKPYKELPTAVSNSLKANIYTEMIEAYMEDFRSQTTFADRLAVGREIRLLLDKL